MLPPLNFLEKLRDFGLFLFRLVVGGTLLFYSLAEFLVGVPAWGRIGEALHVPGPDVWMQVAGLLSLLLVLLGGALLVLGLWIRWAALLLAAAMVAVAAIRWPEAQSGTLEGAARMFYPATLATGLWSLATTGGGRFGLDGVYRERKKAKLNRRRAGK
jgi:putative oxidoreductase